MLCRLFLFQSAILRHLLCIRNDRDCLVLDHFVFHSLHLHRLSRVGRSCSGISEQLFHLSLKCKLVFNAVGLFERAHHGSSEGSDICIFIGSLITEGELLLARPFLFERGLAWVLLVPFAVFGLLGSGCCLCSDFGRIHLAECG